LLDFYALPCTMAVGASQVVLEDSLSERLWVDLPEAKLFVDNILTAFDDTATVPPGAGRGVGKPGSTPGTPGAGEWEEEEVMFFDEDGGADSTELLATDERDASPLRRRSSSTQQQPQQQPQQQQQQQHHSGFGREHGEEL